ncbi:MAG TPA: hypothetical protein PK674_03150 [Candidatus Absconditabacterales bacterium]|nr:hypothetical protein [Candidatus Absconditabacterales bacterium]HOQ79292.1 hypothetical protein [Candidatus Absconditabacterales bacterium]HPK27910.1 hypothetical protein [Candidatus Absconditabacterales bacterium]
MGILSTFEFGFQKRIANESIERYGKENVIVIRKSKFFLWTKVLIPFLFWTTILVVVLVLLIKHISTSWLLWSLIVLSCFLWIAPNIKTLQYFLDYEMDFIVVNPRSFIRYDQDGLFQRVSKTIDLKKIRSISVRKRGFWNSIFNNGSLLVVSEGGEAEQDEKLRAGEINFRNLYNPEAYSKQINEFLSKIFNE